MSNQLNNFLLLQQKINYSFSAPQTLINALTHSSSLGNKSLSDKNFGADQSNERLEYLGDAVLQLVVSEYIFTHHSALTEGEMTRLRASVVCETSLSSHALKLNLNEYIILGKGEITSGGSKRNSILCDAFEALIGAIYCDGGYEPAKEFILSHLAEDINSLHGLKWVADCKTHLQEQLQKNSSDPIEYLVIDSYGPEHKKIFVVQLQYQGKILATAEGKSKKEAEQNAAREAIQLCNLH